MVDPATGKTSRRKATAGTAKVIALPRGDGRPANDNGPLAVAQVGSLAGSQIGAQIGSLWALPGLSLPGLPLSGLPLSGLPWSPALWPAALLLSAWTSWYNFTTRSRD